MNECMTVDHVVCALPAFSQYFHLHSTSCLMTFSDWLSLLLPDTVCCTSSELPSSASSMCVCLCVSELSGLVSQQHPRLAALLSCIKFASIAIVNLQYQTNVLQAQVYSQSVVVVAGYLYGAIKTKVTMRLVT